ncbi:MAG: ATP-dependent zinc metalloprotease FtsH [Tenericutes bacterium]|nr:ATP-dependent zinc metalloprotease FtsH [Mycoplasmatota bacterium]
MKKNNNNYIKQSMPYLVLLLVIVGIMTFYELSQYKVNVFTYDQFISELDKQDVNKLEITAKSGAGIYYITGTLNGYSDKESFEVNAPLSESVVNRVTEYAESNNITLVTGENPERNNIGGVLLNVIPTVLLVGSMLWLLTKLGKSNNNSMDFGRSKAKLSEEAKAHFSDVAGLTEEKEEVAELIDFLKNPKKFQKMGARIPKGVLLVGPPGTGKTLLAKAVAGEANVPFYYISGSDFVELFVGVGASRVRDMFKQAKQTAPCLIFIDEIDAVGRQRGTGLGGGHDEREQTLNQLLTEMDGFGANEGIIIIAATNRPDVLDPALLRPGRFDRQVTVSLPDQKERLAILNVHAKNKVFGSDVNLENISKRTPGYSGADLENLLNEAALLAVRRNLPAIGMAEIDEASDRVLMGPAKVSRKYSENDKKLVSYHEAGHAVIGLKLEHANVVQKVTIIPRGSAGGYNMMIPSEEKICSTKTDLLEEITGLLGGRTAEELVFGEITTGAHNDFEKATKIARAMVTEYGMSDLGPLQFEQQEGSVFLGRDYNKSHNFSNEVANEIDMEMRKIIDECHAKATEIIKQNMDLLKLIAESLLEQETLTKEEIDYLVANGHLPKDDQEVSSEKEEKVVKTKKKKDNAEK